MSVPEPSGLSGAGLLSVSVAIQSEAEFCFEEIDLFKAELDSQCCFILVLFHLFIPPA